MKSIKELEEGCNEDMPYNKCGELKPNYFHQKKMEVIYCLECKALLKQLKDVLVLIDEIDKKDKYGNESGLKELKARIKGDN